MSQNSAQLLREYLTETGMRQEDLAKLFSISRTSIWKYLKGSNVHPLVASRIEKATRGKLKAHILLK